MQIPILTGVQKRHISGLKWSHNLLKNVIFKLNFEHERHLFSSGLFYILTIYHKCLLFQLLSSAILMQIPILTKVE